MEELASLPRRKELIVGLAHAPAGIYGLRLLVAQAGVHCPLAEASRQVAQQLGVPGRLAVDAETEAVQELVIGNRQAALPQLPASGLEPDPHRQAILPG